MANPLVNLIHEGVLALAPLVDLGQDEQSLKGLLGDLGWTPDSIPRPFTEIAAAGSDLLDAIGSDSADASAPQALQAIARLIDAINQIRSRPDSDFPSGIELSIFKETIGRDLLDYLIVEHLLRKRFRIGSLLKLAGLIRLVHTPATGLRQAYLSRHVAWDRIGDLISDPLKGFREAFNWESTNPLVSQALCDLGGLFESYGLHLSNFQVTGDQLKFVNAGATEPVSESFGMDLAFEDNSGTGGITAGVEFLLRPATADRGPAMAILPYAKLNGVTDVALSETVSLSIPGEVDFTKGVAITFSPAKGVELEAGFLGGTGTVPSDIQAGVKIVPATGEQEQILLGTPDGSRLSVRSVRVTAGTVSVPSNGLDVFIELGLEDARIVIQPEPGEADSFIASLLGSNSLFAEFAFGLRLSSITGFHFTGSGGLRIIIPVNARLPLIDLEALSLGLSASNQGVAIEIGATIAGNLGPLAVLVDGVGFKFSTTFSDPPTGNLGPFDVDFGFLAPSAVGLAVDSAGVSGGGFLAHDDAKHEYSGVLQLQFTDLSLQAFGLITTQVAGTAGYSLLALVDANFPPIALGWGFTLNGVGGLLAVNRSASVDALRAALKADKLSSVLFPKNAITNAPQILAQLDSLFPTAHGRFLFGPMALIGWGTPTVLTAAIAVIVELPEPIRILLLARVAVRAPTESNALVRINMDALGVLDLNKSELSLDAVLFDSRLITFTLSGSMALRATWAGQREFLLAIGGFHPRFTPPPSFPALQRITIDMPSGIVSKLRLAAYFAITSNTVQMGANLDVFVGVSGFGLSGHLGFDALLQLSPFHFEVDISGKVALTAGGDDLMSVSLDATLSGPAPWHISGSFKIHIVFFDVHISFAHSWGEEAPAVAATTVDVAQLLKTTLADARSWDAQMPDGVAALTPMRQIQDAASVLAHPLALPEVHERIVPLGLAITRFGEAAPAGASRFDITDWRVGGSAPPRATIDDDFAPAQFFDLSDEEKLARPSFERHTAGVQMNAGLVTSGPAATKKILYETSFIDEPGGEPRPDPGVPVTPPLFGDLVVILEIGSAARSSISRASYRKYSSPGNPIRVAEPRFAVVDGDSLASAGVGPSGGSTYSEAAALLASAISRAPDRRGALGIVATHEMAAA